MSTIPEADTDSDTNGRTVTLAEMDASVCSVPDVPEDEIAARYYSDERVPSSDSVATRQPHHRLGRTSRCRI